SQIAVSSGIPLNCSAATIDNATICVGSPFTVTANFTGGGTPYVFAWSDGNGGIYSNAKSIVAELPEGTNIIECMVTDNCGQVCHSTITEESVICSITLNSKLFIQGYYSGGGMMQNAGAGFMFVAGVPGATITDVDTVRIGAMNPTSPYALVDEQLGILQ